MEQKEIERIHSNLTKNIEKYINAIILKYGNYIPYDKLVKLSNIVDYGSLIKIFDYGSINGYANRTSINMPLSVDKAFDIVSKIPGYGINKKHMPYNKKNMILREVFKSMYPYKYSFFSAKDTIYFPASSFTN